MLIKTEKYQAPSRISCTPHIILACYPMRMNREIDLLKGYCGIIGVINEVELSLFSLRKCYSSSSKVEFSLLMGFGDGWSGCFELEK